MRNGPITPVEVEAQILRLSEMLEEETESFAVLAEDEASKRSRHKAQWAKEYLGGKGPVKDREAWADYKGEMMHYDWAIAEALLKAKREKLSSIRTQLDSLRTIAANVRTMVNS